MSPVVPSATLDTASAPLATRPPAVAQLDDASAQNASQNGAAAAAGAAQGNDSAAGAGNAATTPATDTSSTTAPTPSATNPPPNANGAADKSAASPPAAPTNTDTKGSANDNSANDKGANANANDKTKGAATQSAQNTQVSATPASTPSANPNANSSASASASASAATPTVGSSASDTSAPPAATQSSAAPPSGTPPSPSDPSTTPPPAGAAPTFGASSSPTDTQTQTQANVGIGQPTPSSLPSTNSGTSFLQNKGLVIGLAVAGGLLVVLFLIYVITRSLRSRRRRQLDREMDASFEETMNRWRPADHGHDEGADLRRAPSAMSTASAAAYAQPPMAVAPQAPNYGFGYAPQQEYWTAAPPQPPQMSMAPGMGMGMMQQTQTHAQWEGGLARGPSQSAAVQLAPPPQQVQTQPYLSNYAPQNGAGAGAENHSPVSPTLMPNPFDERVLKVANE